MNGDKAFVDTNLLIYLYSETEPLKTAKVMNEITKYERYISTQVLCEFCSVGIRKLKLSIDVVKSAVTEIINSSNLLIVNYSTVISALQYHVRYKYSYYDSLMVASALKGDCKYLLSEDLADGQEIEGRLTIKNIFIK